MNIYVQRWGYKFSFWVGGLGGVWCVWGEGRGVQRGYLPTKWVVQTSVYHRTDSYFVCVDIGLGVGIQPPPYFGGVK